MKEDFKVIKNLISKDTAELIGLCYLNLLPQPKNLECSQMPGTPSYGGAPITETLMMMILGDMKKHTGLELHPTYSYLRVYQKGDELAFHTDREACEISCTINLKQSHPWSIFMRPNLTSYGEEEVILHPGDACIYKGMDVVHGRYPFEGDYCVQVFCHYVHTYLDHIDDKLHSDKGRFINNLG